ncbi:hypothetical protein C8R44DRAFT_881381 [Mycena epipterygia]|nr:hypothetical protein C8R44DRAFT_881381 [Mycena epipterygia]
MNLHKSYMLFANLSILITCTLLSLAVAIPALQATSTVDVDGSVDLGSIADVGIAVGSGETLGEVGAAVNGTLQALENIGLPRDLVSEVERTRSPPPLTTVW